MRIIDNYNLMKFNEQNSIKYFWASPSLLGEGSIVRAGNLGRIMKQYRPNVFGNPWLAIKEYVFEDVRKQFYSNHPGRLGCLFLCKDIESIKRFVSSNGRITDLIYEVEIMDNSKAFLEADWNGVNHQSESISELEEKAHAYWKAENIQNVEVLTMSDIKIIRQIVCIPQDGPR